MLTGVMVAFAGAIGFIGLMVPHTPRILLGADSTRSILGSTLIGATIVAPEGMPISIIIGWRLRLHSTATARALDREDAKTAVGWRDVPIHPKVAPIFKHLIGKRKEGDMVGLGPTITSFLGQHFIVSRKLVDGPRTNVGLRRRAKHNHD